MTKGVPPLAERLVAPAPLDAAEAKFIARAFLDTFACIIAGLAEPVAQHLQAAHDGASRVDLVARAQVLGTAAHAQDFDDYEAMGSTHPSAVLVAVIAALSEAETVSVEEATQAYGAGYQVISSLGALMGYGHYQAGWHATATLGTLGAAVTAAQGLGLGPDGAATALCLAASRAGGLKGQFGSGAKPLQAGLAAGNGIECALMAASGVDARRDVLEGKDGFLQVFGGDCDPLTCPLPRLSDNPLLIKPWPTCAYAHRAIEAAEQIAAEPGFAAADMTEITLTMAAPYANVAGQRAPQFVDQARFATPYLVASTLRAGRFEARCLAETALADPEVQRMEAMVKLETPALPKGLGDMSPDAPDHLRVVLSDGQVFETSIGHVKGGPEKPLSDAGLVAKYTDCGGDQTVAEAFLIQSRTAPLPRALWHPKRS